MTKEEVQEKMQSVKKHIKKNKKQYITGGVCLLVGFAGGELFMLNRSIPGGLAQKITQIGIWNDAIIIAALGDPGDVVRILESTPEWEKLGIRAGMLFQSRGALARALETSVAKVSGHLNGHNQDVKGIIAEVVGKAGQPIAA